MSKISIVVSFRNEEEALPLLVEGLRGVLDPEPEDYELLFVNDDSSDRSVDVLEGLAVQGAPIRVVNMSRRFGVEECFMAGVEHSTGDAVILMYSDLQDPVETIPEMLTRWRDGAEIVHTIRRKRIGEPVSKVIAAHFAYRLINYFSDIPIPPDSGDFKLISRKVCRHLLEFRETDPYLRGLIPWVGYRQDEVTYDLQPRPVGNSKVPLFGYKALTVLLSGLTSFTLFPVFSIVIVGGACLGLSVLAALALVLMPGMASPVVGLGVYLTILWSGLLLAVGTVGLYAGRAFKNGQSRPLYIVDEVLDFTAKAQQS